MAEVTDQGYVLKIEQEYFDQEIALYQGIDPEWNLDPSTPDGAKAANDAEVFAQLDEALQAAYNSKDPNKARGTDLNIIGRLSGSSRSQGSPSTVPIELGGTNGTLVEAGKRIESETDGTVWRIDDDVTIGLGPTPGTATAVENGATQANAGTITKIVDSVGGWASVTNTGPATAGTNPDNNAEFRLKRELSVGRPGDNQIDSIRGELFATPGVSNAEVYENDTGVTDSNGLPPHSMAIIADGGTDEDVALSIYIKKNPGVTLHPAGVPVIVTVVSPRYPQNQKDITFSRPIDDPMTMNVSVANDGSLPANAEDLIKTAVLDCVGGDLIESEVGFNATGFKIGENVAVSRLYTPVNKVIGAFGNSYIQSLDVNGSTSEVPVNFNAISRWTYANINVIIS